MRIDVFVKIRFEHFYINANEFDIQCIKFTIMRTNSPDKQLYVTSLGTAFASVHNKRFAINGRMILVRGTSMPHSELKT